MRAQRGGSGVVGDPGRNARRWRGLLALGACAVLTLGAAAPKAPVPKPEPPAPRFDPTVITDRLDRLAATQAELAASEAGLRTLLEANQRAAGEVLEAVRATRAALDVQFNEIRDMREEVKGLYFESSTVKNDIYGVGQRIEGLDQNLDAFRLSSGIVVAVVIVLQVVLIGLAFRGRG